MRGAPTKGATTDTSQATLDRLVSQTEGLQPFRKLFHATNAILIAAAITLLDLSRAQELAILAGIFGLLLAGDLMRLNVPRANALFFVAFRQLASPREAAGVASSTWYALGVLLAVFLAPREAAVSAILVLGLADPAASYIGVRWGKRPFMGGTLEGTAAFVAVAATILLLRHPMGLAGGVAVVAGLAERRSWPLDDNLTVPVVCALLLVVGSG